MSSTNLYHIASVADMKAGFPPPPPPVVGQPTLLSLVTLITYIAQCAQTHRSPISPSMNLLYTAVNAKMYANFTDEDYPNGNYPFPPEVPDVPNYALCFTENDRARVKTEHALAQKTRADVINMNAALCDTFLSLIPEVFRAAYDHRRLNNPNSVFNEMFEFFVTKFGASTPDDREANRQRMAMDWHPSQGFETLENRLFIGQAYSHVANHPINDEDLVDIGLRVLRKCGLYPEEYKSWIARDEKERTYAHFKQYWALAIDRATAATTTTAGMYNYGMAASTNNNTTTVDDEITLYRNTNTVSVGNNTYKGNISASSPQYDEIHGLHRRQCRAD